MSKLEVDAIEPQSGTTLTIGASGDSVNIASGATITDFTSTGIDDNATSTAITIDSSQNVGIGTASPSEKLSVVGGTGGAVRIELKNDGTASGDNASLDIVTSPSGNGYIIFGDTDDTNVGSIQYVHSDNSMRFVNNATEKIRIDTGLVLIKESLRLDNSVERNSLSFNGVDAGGGNFYFGKRGTATSSNLAMVYGSGTGNNNGMILGQNGYLGIGDDTPDQALDVVGNIHYTGTITDVSDRRLKENIADLSDSLNKICQLNAKSYTMIADRNNEEDETELGFIAQDVQNVFPEIVKIIQKYAVDENGEKTEEEINYLGVSYIQLIAPMVEAIKTLKAKNDSLEARITALENK